MDLKVNPYHSLAFTANEMFVDYPSLANVSNMVRFFILDSKLKY